ncbi:DUF2589 domain-containing protein [Sediminispirochaeta bajacaliforniensis]|uniref:DUF2589 domain-containing protein n=1 Tax=Sediminispirochaeta bajacaliforniensis TaxID=148 RepID=UPI00036610B5|nr:DUF2589 domain-containing protein [Sediminispirochaeta bajacaliforniensis]
MADYTKLSLAQAILASVDSIIKAQIHASRSFLSSILQMGFGHQGLDDEGNILNDENKSDNLYRLEFIQEREINGEIKKYRVSVPTLAALPMNPLMIHDAQIDFKMKITSIEPEKIFGIGTEEEMRTKDKNKWHAGKRPWFLVEEPKSFIGEIRNENEKSDCGFIGVKINIGSIDVPDALGTYINALSEFSIAEPLDDQGVENV